MAELRFEWEPQKAAANADKHGVGFDEAVTVFSDEGGLLLDDPDHSIDDPDHSIDEGRFILLGLSANLRVLVVVHCYRENDAVIRLISTRKATRVEQRMYVTRNS